MAYITAIEWLTEAMKRYDEYYDQHMIKAVEILEELALSFIGSNQIDEARKVVEKVSRMNADSHVVKFFKSTKLHDSMKVDDKLDPQKLCHSIHFLRSNILTCPKLK